ncbi:MAG: hypothetical protein AVDCRST_MAG59-1431, partial [uncultured Thermomicrobiales bacterium]
GPGRRGRSGRGTPAGRLRLQPQGARQRADLSGGPRAGPGPAPVLVRRRLPVLAGRAAGWLGAAVGRPLRAAPRGPQGDPGNDPGRPRCLVGRGAPRGAPRLDAGPRRSRAL